MSNQSYRLAEKHCQLYKLSGFRRMLVDADDIRDYAGRTISVSGQPHPSVNAVFLRPKFVYGRDDRPKYKTFGEYASRLTAVVESRLPITNGKVSKLNCKEAVMAAQSHTQAAPSAPEAQLIPVFTGTIGGEQQPVCDGRALHQFLQVITRFNDWIARRIEEYGFIDGEDFYSILSKTKGRSSKDYHLTLDMAKELSMVENNEQGRQARRYFIAMEKAAQQKTAPLPPSAPSFQTRLLLCIEHGQVVSSQPVPQDACVIAPGNPASLRSLIGEYVPPELLPEVAEIAHQRLLACFQADLKRKAQGA